METKVIDIKLLAKKLIDNWKLILIITAAGFVLGAILSFGVPRKYTVVSKVAPELSLRTNSLTSFAQIAGINNLLSNNNDALLPSVYPDIVSSTPFLCELCRMQVNDSTLYHYLKNDVKMSWLGAVISLPMRAVGGIKSWFSDDDQSETFMIDPYRPTKEQAATLRMLGKMIRVDVEKKTFLVTISVTAQDPVIAADLSKKVIYNLKQTVTLYRTKKAADNVVYLEKVFADAEKDYNDIQSEYAYYLDHNQSIASKLDLVQSMKFKNELDLKFQLYSSLATELQQARTKVLQETPVFAEIAPPSVPVRSSNSRKKFAMAFAFVALIAACGYVLIKK